VTDRFDTSSVPIHLTDEDASIGFRHSILVRSQVYPSRTDGTCSDQSTESQQFAPGMFGTPLEDNAGKVLFQGWTG
jgi:hypothetical protein